MSVHVSSKRITQLFDIGIALKGFDGVLEIIAGIALLPLNHTQMSWLIYLATRHELLEDPHDFIALFFLHTITHISPHGQLASVVFLLSHGFMKVFLSWQLFRGRIWAYPLTIAVLLFFIVLQIFEIFSGHSLILIALTILDALIIVLTWHEYQRKKLLKNEEENQM